MHGTVAIEVFTCWYAEGEYDGGEVAIPCTEDAGTA